jgi:ribosomal protein L44E
VAKAPDTWATYCPECKAKIKLAVTVKEGPKIRGQQAIEARVAVDTTKMREHMKDAHGIVPAGRKEPDERERTA